MAAKLQERDVVVEDRELEQARKVLEELPQERKQFTATAGEASVQIPRELSLIISRILRAVADGGTVTVGTMPAELTTTTAAKHLGMSRPTLMNKIKSGEIAAHKVGTHTRLRTADVLEFKRARRERRRKAFDELRELDDAD